MPGPNTPYTALDFAQVIRQSFDESADRLRVDATVTASIGTVILDASTSDIAIQDRVSGYFLKINSDGSIDVNVSVSAGSGDSINSWLHDGVGVAVTLGQKTKAGSIPVVLPSDQPISVSGSVGVLETGTVDTAYNEVLSVASSILTTVTTYTAIQPTRIKWIDVSGTNIATYTVYVNGTPISKKRTYYGNLDNSFQYSKGYALLTSDVVAVKVEHTQPSVGDFNAFILVLKD